MKLSYFKIMYTSNCLFDFISVKEYRQMMFSLLVYSKKKANMLVRSGPFYKCWLFSEVFKIQGYSKWLSGFKQLFIHNTLEIGLYVFFLFNRITLQVFVTYLLHPLWFYKHKHDNRVRSKPFVARQRWWFQWRFCFVPSVPGYLREEEDHKPDPWRNLMESNHMGLHLENEVASC